ncbi:MAG: hypothetical protein AVDCRST_MAG89-5000 [uncultured Gemmatimonadetes bacterium]|uniref:Uncharacterized protein n=1 Tax=uncultured Gemmatimonadota bacterium TaxID=203437 RepID=A0A6J4N643_9BACT|nr:MAG: hypothetical protein AVDCRST_MAG89-5000 [uncultured Gemmatimonadota bacterium]
MKLTSWTEISRVMVRALFLITGGAALVTACSDGGTESTRIGPQDPRMDYETGCPQGSTAEQCAEFNRAVDFLKNHPNPDCAGFGQSAAQRDANNDYFVSRTNSFGYAEKDYGVSGQVGLGNSTWGNNELANTIAHEESHLTKSAEDTPSGNWFDNNAYMWGYTCGFGYTSY